MSEFSLEANVTSPNEPPPPSHFQPGRNYGGGREKLPESSQQNQTEEKDASIKKGKKENDRAPVLSLLSVWLIRLARPYYANSCWSITTHCIECIHKPLAFIMVNRVGLQRRLRCPVGARDEWTERLDRKHSIICCKAAATPSIHLPIISSINSFVYKTLKNRRGMSIFISLEDDGDVCFINASKTKYIQLYNTWRRTSDPHIWHAGIKCLVLRTEKISGRFNVSKLKCKHLKSCSLLPFIKYTYWFSLCLSPFISIFRVFPPRMLGTKYGQ